MKYELIKATSKDIDLLMEYKYKSILPYAPDTSKEYIKRIENYVKKNTPKQIDDYRLITVDGKLAGCLLVTPEDDGVLLDEIYIEEEFRGKGLGTDIIKKIISQNKVVYLWVYKENKIALSLYKKLGFFMVEETESRIKMKCEGE